MRFPHVCGHHLDPRTPLLFFSHPVMPDSLQPPGLQHTRLLCPSLSPGVCSNSCSLSQWCHPNIPPSVTSFSSCLQSFLASGLFLVSWLFASGGQALELSFSISPCSQYSGSISFRIDWFDLLAAQGTLKSIVQHHSWKTSFFGTQPSLWLNSHIHTWLLEKP